MKQYLLKTDLLQIYNCRLGQAILAQIRFATADWVKQYLLKTSVKHRISSVINCRLGEAIVAQNKFAQNRFLTADLVKQYLLKTNAKSRIASVISAWLLEGRSYSLSGSAPGEDGGLGVEGGVAGVEGVCDCNRLRTN